MKNNWKKSKSFSLKYRIINALSIRGILDFFIFNIRTAKKPTFKIPVIAGQGYSHLKEKEPWMELLFRNILTNFRGKTFVDVGVNLGQTLLKIKSLKGEVNYVGFEPNPFCVNYVNELIRINRIENVIVLAAGISVDSDINDLLFNENEFADSSATMVHEFREGRFDKIPALFINPNIIPIWNGTKIGCIKIDVEGAELKVLLAFEKLLNKYRPFIICEILPCYSEDNDFRIKSQQQIERLLQTLDYKIYRINIQDASLDLIKKVGIHSNLEWSNYLFAPSESAFK